jgi:Competence protein CoiA-like family
MTDRFADLLLPFGERVADGRMVRPTEVANGLACDCVCAKCRRRLIARLGAIVQAHFAHEADVECSGAFESSMHAMAKEIISDARMVRTPVIGAAGYAWTFSDGESSPCPGCTQPARSDSSADLGRIARRNLSCAGTRTAAGSGAGTDPGGVLRRGSVQHYRAGVDDAAACTAVLWC